MTNREIVDDLAAAAGHLRYAQEAVRNAREWVTSGPVLPAAELSEGAIVAALAEDFDMAGRIIAKVAAVSSSQDRATMSDAARHWCSDAVGSTLRGLRLQSLAVALAAASYRGA